MKVLDDFIASENVKYRAHGITWRSPRWNGFIAVGVVE